MLWKPLIGQEQLTENAMIIMSKVAKGLGCTSTDVVLSRETIRRKRKGHREECDKVRKEWVEIDGTINCTLGWETVRRYHW